MTIGDPRPEGYFSSLSRMTPTGYARHLRRLYIPNPHPSGPSAATLDVNQYISAATGSNSAAGPEIYRPILEAVSTDQERSYVGNVRSGVGNAEEIRFVAVTALEADACTTANLQTYCRTTLRIGVDCVGFASGYLIGAGLTRHRVGSTEGFASPRRFLPRRNLSDIQPNDLLVSIPAYVIGGSFRTHVAVVEEYSNGKCLIAESRGRVGPTSGLVDLTQINTRTTPPIANATWNPRFRRTEFVRISGRENPYAIWHVR